MAGAVAMASVIEDFDTQPCKKQRKDGDTTSVQPITNYFQPMPKTTEKLFSSPKPNCITDYFKKTPPALEKSSMSEQCKENGQNQRETAIHTETPVRPPKAQRLRKSRKPGKVLDFSQQAQGDCSEVITLSESSCSNDEMAPLREAGLTPVLLGSETAALLAQVCTEAFGGEKSPPTGSSAATDKHPKKCFQETPRRRPSVRKKLRGSSDCSLESLEEYGKESNRGAGGDGEAAVQSPRPYDVRVEVDKAAGLNGGTITISFEDFLQSQNKEDTASPKGIEKDAEVQSVAAAAQGEPQQVSPRTLTIQAEVHPVSKAPELVMSTKKRLASIFTRRRTQEHDKSKMEDPGSPQEKSESLPAPRRKSNVVLHEEDLELAVIEPGATPKCSQAERKQFMNAFRQPGQETGKTSKPKKGPGRQEMAVERAPEVQEDPLTSVEATTEEEGQTSTSQPVEDEKQGRSGRKGGSRLRRAGKKNAEEPSLVPALEEKPSLGTQQKDDRFDLAGDGSNTPTGTTQTRRSTRSHPQQVTSEQKVTMQTPSTRSRERLQEQRLPEKASQGNSSPVVTPKTHRLIHDVYRAQMLSPPDDKGSPIRMRIQRVFMDSEPKSGSDFEILSPVPTKAGASKSRKQARKLLQKARAVQQNKKKGEVNDKGSVRRSLRNRNLKTTYCEDEDSVVCLEGDQEEPVPAAKTKAEGQKQLRTVNEVLGKAATVSKEANGCTASKVAPIFLIKKGQKPSAVISIFDDSSREGSENSQDDEQFKARREFLKSGLPESFKKQIARSVASQEAYSAACTSFQAVVHVRQRPLDCPIWSLPWPGSPLFKHLETCCLEPPKPVLSPGQLSYSKTLPALRAHIDKGSGWREDLSEQVRRCLLEEVRASNPPFPVRRFFTRFLKKRADHLLQCMALDSDESLTAPSAPAPSKSSGKKRKHRQEEGGREELSKRRRSSRGQPIVIEDSPPPASESAGASSELPRRSRLNRAQQQKMVDGNAPTENSPLIVLDDTLAPPGNSGKGGCVKEDVLWTEKYQPQHSSEVIGNSAAVKKVYSWLKDWKLRADREEKRNQKERKQEDDSNDSWDSGVFHGEEEPGEEQLCNTLLITGPSGVGKTAAVYACAQELGFKVFEVNASSQRSGRQILSQLKEATQSHQVDIQGTGVFKPSFFNSYSAGSVRCSTSPRKMNSPRKVVSSPRKPPQSPRGAAPKRGSLAPTTLAEFFKMARPKGKNPDSLAVCPQSEARPRIAGKAKEGLSTGKPAPSRKEPAAEEQSKKTATSLILFEEVDVIFEDDSGFLAAIKTFMTTTKRPVILTTSDPTFSTMFDGHFEEIHFETPSAVNVGTYLQLVCLAENVRTDPGDLSSLLCWTNCDVRHSLLQLQFWVRSGGGRPAPQPSLAPPPESTGESGLVPDKEGPTKNVDPPASLPPCDTSCTESLLGLLNIEPALDVQHLCKCKSSTEPESQRFWEVLSDSWGRGVDLLYSNMEYLLPLPTGTLRNRGPSPLEVPNPVPQEEAGSSRPHPWVDELLNDKSPVKVSSSSRRRKIHSGQFAVLSDVDSDVGFLSLCHLPQTTASNSEETAQSEASREEAQTSKTLLRAGKRADLSPAEQKADELVSSCLDSLAGFLDHMSFLDSSLAHTELESTFRGAALSWMVAGMKNGLTDEPRTEPVVGGAGRSVVEIRATVEAMSFQQCRAAVERVWTGAEELEQEAREEVFGRLSLPVARHRRSFSLGHTRSCEPSVVKKRSQVLRAVSSRVCGILGNKPAAAIDYLPMLRTICRSERVKEQGKVKRRFLHYLDGIHLNLPRNIVQHLAEDFP